MRRSSVGQALRKVGSKFADHAGIAASTLGVYQFDGRKLRQAQTMTNHAQRRCNKRARKHGDSHALQGGQLQTFETWTDETEMPRSFVVLERRHRASAVGTSFGKQD